MWLLDRRQVPPRCLAIETHRFCHRTLRCLLEDGEGWEKFEGQTVPGEAALAGYPSPWKFTFPKGKDRLPSTVSQGRAVKLQGSIKLTMDPCFKKTRFDVWHCLRSWKCFVLFFQVRIFSCSEMFEDPNSNLDFIGNFWFGNSTGE